MKPKVRTRDFRAAQSRNGDLDTANHSSEHFYSRVAALAYSLYERRGGEHGHDVEDWIQAEKTILEGHNRVAAKMKESSRNVVSEAGPVREKTKRG